MLKDQLQTRDKVVQQLSREGLVEENVTKQTVQNISNANNSYQITEPETRSSGYDFNQNKVYHASELDTFSNSTIPVEQQADYMSSSYQNSNQTAAFSSGYQATINRHSSISSNAVTSESEVSAPSIRTNEDTEKVNQEDRSKKDNKKNIAQERKRSLKERTDPEQKLKESSKKSEKKLVEEKKKGLAFEHNEDEDKPGQRIKEKSSKNLKYKNDTEAFELEEESSVFEMKSKEKKGGLDRKRLNFDSDISLEDSEDSKEVFKVSDKQKELFKKSGAVQFGNSYPISKKKMIGQKDAKTGTIKSSGGLGRLLEKNDTNIRKNGKNTIIDQKGGKIKERHGTKLIEGSRYQKPSAAADVKKEFQKKMNQQKAIESFQKSKKNKEFLIVVKKALIKIAAAVKSAAAVLFGFSTIFIVIILVLAFAAMYLLQMALAGIGTLSGGVYQSSYTDMSDCESYFRELETVLEERIEGIEEEYPGYYEYLYQLETIEHNAVELMSYLATKYPDLTLEKSKAELESLFEERYQFFVEIKEELREVEKRDEEGNIIYDDGGNPVKESVMVKICYITLEVKPWDQIMEGRLSAGEKERYDVYLLSRGAQQVYGNPLVENWSNKITSNFGYRIHPITKEKALHAGLDIAVPIGTPLYSCTDGIVTTSRYSDSAGNFIVVLLESGYSVTYMHLDSLGVKQGDTVTKGMLIGATGNSGRSTGPHLHVEVRTEKNQPIDPTFIISNGVNKQE